MAIEHRDVESRFQEIHDTLARIERRLDALEAAAPRAAQTEAPVAGTVAAVPATPTGARDHLELPLALSLAGRTLMVFGGAFLLRALTDAGWLPRAGGIALGLAYAVAWLVAADRAGGRERRWSALFHGTAGIAIGLALIWEAALRFGLIGLTWSAALLAVATGLALAVAWRRRLQTLAGLTMLGAIATAIGLATAGEFLSFTVFLILLGVATLWISYDRDWFWIRWPAAIVANLAVVGLTTRALNVQQLERPDAVIAVQILLIVAYLGSFTTRTLIRGRLVVPFEVLQTVAALAIGFGGAIAVARAVGTGEVVLGATSALLGAGCYAAAFAFVGRRQGLGANFYFYATLALMLTLAGCWVVLADLTCTVILGLLSVVTTWFGHRLSRQTLVVHGAVYAATAAVSSGLIPVSIAALWGIPATWPAFGVACWIAFAASAICLMMPRHGEGEPSAALDRLPWLAFASLVALGAGGAVVAGLGPAVAGSPPDPGRLAALRTAVIAGAAVLMAWTTRSARGWELGWLLYPVLVLGGVKLLVEDMQASGPTPLFIALALFGAALVAAPRLTRRTPRHGAH